MLRADLAAAEIPYKDASGLVFDFHALRCQTATLADAAGVSPRVVQKMMRHSTLELTGRYTRPRAVDIEAAASKLPSLRPSGDRPEPMAMTGTDAVVTPQSGSALAARSVPDQPTSVQYWSNGKTIAAPGSLPEVVATGRGGLKQAGTGEMTGLGLEPRTNGLKVRCSTD